MGRILETVRKQRQFSFVSLLYRLRLEISFLCTVASSPRRTSFMAVVPQILEKDEYRPRERKQALERLQEAV